MFPVYPFIVTIVAYRRNFLTLGFQKSQTNFSYDNITIKNVSEEKIQRITIDNKLNFQKLFEKYLQNS